MFSLPVVAGGSHVACKVQFLINVLTPKFSISVVSLLFSGISLLCSKLPVPEHK